MFITFCKTAWRNLSRNRAYSLLNIIGLGAALAACLIIFLVLQHETSFDRYHRNADRLYQIVRKINTPNGDDFEAGIPFEATKALRNDYPQLRFTQLFTSNGSQVTVMQGPATISDKKFIEDRGVFFAEPELLQLFDVHWLSGSAVVLGNPNTTVLCRSLAEKYFGSSNQALGKYIRLDNSLTFQVAGVIDDVPATSDFPFRVLLSYRTFLNSYSHYGFTTLEGWSASVTNQQVYTLLPDHADPASIAHSFRQWLDKYAPKEVTAKQTYFIRPLADIHFDTRFENNGDHISSKTSLYTLGLIGLLIILMACINFVNLSTALAVKRSREVGVRKVMGSSRRQLQSQVFIETGLLVLLSVSIGLLLAYSSLPYLKYLFDARATLQLFNPGSCCFIGSITLLTILLAGFYPAWVMSRFNPTEAFRSKMDLSRIGSLSLRRVLVVMQFAFSQLLIIATLITISQMSYIHHADLGFNKEAVLVLYGNSDSTFLSRQAAFKNALRALPGIESVSYAFEAPCGSNDWRSGFAFDNEARSKDFSATLKFGDADYLRTFGLRLAAGKFYDDKDTTGGAVINRTMVAKLGLSSPMQAVGKTIRLGSGKWRSIVGVVEDFKTNSMRSSIPPAIIIKRERFYQEIALKINSNNPGRVDREASLAWGRFFPEYAYVSRFLDDSINQFYIQDQRLSTLYKVSAILAILISCLGLYGLVSFMALQKTKEIGVRKVLGATVRDIVYLFSREFTLLILLAFLLAAPAGWFLMNQWLRDFAYRIHFGPAVFVLAILISLGIAWLTVGYRSVRAAMANPTRSLRSE